jgi:hypothetical protein
VDHRLLTVSEAVSHSVCGIAARVDRKSALQPMVAGFVQEIADGNHPGHSSSEEDQLASGPALAQRFCHGIQFSASVTQIAMRDPKVHSFERGVAGKQCLVGCVPKTVFRCNLGQDLSAACAAARKHDEEKT